MYALATLIGLVMGGIQSLSRSTYAKLIPENTPDTVSYFNFYDVVEKLSIVSGTLMYGLVIQLTSNIRYSFVVLAFVFAVGLLFLSRIILEKKAAAVRGIEGIVIIFADSSLFRMLAQLINICTLASFSNSPIYPVMSF